MLSNSAVAFMAHAWTVRGSSHAVFYDAAKRLNRCLAPQAPQFRDHIVRILAVSEPWHRPMCSEYRNLHA